jgi:hypothetical protein
VVPSAEGRCHEASCWRGGMRRPRVYLASRHSGGVGRNCPGPLRAPATEWLTSGTKCPAKAQADAAKSRGGAPRGERPASLGAHARKACPLADAPRGAPPPLIVRGRKGRRAHPAPTQEQGRRSVGCSPILRCRPGAEAKRRLSGTDLRRFCRWMGPGSPRFARCRDDSGDCDTGRAMQVCVTPAARVPGALRREVPLCRPGTPVLRSRHQSNRGPASAQQRFTLQRVRDTSVAPPFHLDSPACGCWSAFRLLIFSLAPLPARSPR